MSQELTENKEEQWPDITGGESLWDTPPTRPPPLAANVAAGNQLIQQPKVMTSWFYIHNFLFCVNISFPNSHVLFIFVPRKLKMRLGDWRGRERKRREEKQKKGKIS